MRTGKKETNRKWEPVRTLNGRMFRKQKGRNLAAVLAIVMTAMMFTTLFTLAQSMNENLIEMTFRQTGYNAQASFKQIDPADAEKIAAHPDVEEVGESLVLGIAQNDGLAGRQVEIRWADESYASHSFAEPTTGHMPQKADEAALDTLTLDRLGIPHEVGQTVTLEWKKDLTDPQEEPFSSQFTLCGFWEGNESVYASMAWVSREFADEMTGKAYNTGSTLGQYMAQVSLCRDDSIASDMDRVLQDTGLEGLEYSVNLAYSPEMGATALQETLPMYLGMILVFLAGYLIIYNIFQISVTADVQFYGKLKTLGTTARQLKKLIYGQAARLCLLGIPLGLLLGWFLGLVLVPAFTGVLEGGGKVSVNPVIFVGAAVFTCMTVLISCLRPAHLAGKVSPVEALRMSDADGKGKKKTRRGEKGASLAGMAWANLGRNRKRTVIVICSLSLGLVLLDCFYAKNAAFDMEKYLADLTVADFTLTDATSEDYIGGYNPQGTTLNEDLVRQMEQMEGTEAVGHLYSKWTDWTLDDGTAENIENFYTEDKMKDWASYDPHGAEQVTRALEERQAGAVLYGMDGIPLEVMTQQQYLMQGSFDPEAFAAGNFVLAVGPSAEPGEPYDLLPAPSAGSQVTLDGKSYTVMAVVYPAAPVMEGASETGAADVLELSFILPLDTFRQLYPDHTMRKLFVNVEDSCRQQTQQWLKEYTETVDVSLPVISRQTMAEQYEAETRSSAVMGNAVSIIIALVGVLNFVNSMVTAIVSRRREFAMIQSVGMTKKQLCRMLVFEGLYYAGITLAVSFVISALAVGVVIRAMVEGGFTTFHFTLLPLGICAPVLLLFAVLIPFLCFKNLEKQSIVERLRMD